jgi:DNA-binding NarL/FixJ family response regulator
VIAPFRHRKYGTSGRLVGKVATESAWDWVLDSRCVDEGSLEITSHSREALFRAIDDPDEREVLELSLQGYTAAEIGERLGRAER